MVDQARQGRLIDVRIMVLLGAEFNAELQRGREMKAGHPEHEEPFVEPRDTRRMSDAR